MPLCMLSPWLGARPAERSGMSPSVSEGSCSLSRSPFPLPFGSTAPSPGARPPDALSTLAAPVGLVHAPGHRPRPGSRRTPHSSVRTAAHETQDGETEWGERRQNHRGSGCCWELEPSSLSSSSTPHPSGRPLIPPTPLAPGGALLLWQP